MGMNELRWLLISGRAVSGALDLGTKLVPRTREGGSACNAGSILFTYCPRIHRHSGAGGSHRRCREQLDARASRSRTALSPGSDPGLCRSSDHPGLLGARDTDRDKDRKRERERK